VLLTIHNLLLRGLTAMLTVVVECLIGLGLNRSKRFCALKVFLVGTVLTMQGACVDRSYEVLKDGQPGPLDSCYKPDSGLVVKPDRALDAGADMTPDQPLPKDVGPDHWPAAPDCYVPPPIPDQPQPKKDLGPPDQVAIVECYVPMPDMAVDLPQVPDMAVDVPQLPDIPVAMPDCYGGLPPKDYAIPQDKPVPKDKPAMADCYMPPPPKDW